MTIFGVILGTSIVDTAACGVTPGAVHVCRISVLCEVADADLVMILGVILGTSIADSISCIALPMADVAGDVHDIVGIVDSAMCVA